MAKQSSNAPAGLFGLVLHVISISISIYIYKLICNYIYICNNIIYTIIRVYIYIYNLLSCSCGKPKNFPVKLGRPVITLHNPHLHLAKRCSDCPSALNAWPRSCSVQCCEEMCRLDPTGRSATAVDQAVTTSAKRRNDEMISDDH